MDWKEMHIMQASHKAVEGIQASLAGEMPKELPSWTPPRTRREADEHVLLLSNDIGLILAQLAEDEMSWCRRTGRTNLDYAAWRRRALFAKVHMERQLRECKRIRSLLSIADTDGAHAGEPGADLLVEACRRVLEAWDADRSDPQQPLDRALLHLAEVVEKTTTMYVPVDLLGARPAEG